MTSGELRGVQLTRRGVIASAMASPALLLAACSGSEPAGSGGKPDVLRVAYQDIPNGAMIVKHERWLEHAVGVPVHWVRYDSGAAVNQAVGKQEVDVGLAGTSSIAIGVPRGLSYKVAWIFDVIGSAESLAVRKDSGITSLSDLVGKRIAVPFGSTTHYALLAALQRAHVDDDLVNIVDLQPDQIVQAWKAGRIDAAYTWQPSLSKVLADNGRVLLTSADLAKHGILTADLGVVSDRMADHYPGVVVSWLTQQERAVRFYQDHPEKAAAAVGDELGISTRQALREMKGYTFLNAGQQLTPRYLGTPSRTGNLARQLTSTAVFLQKYPQTVKFLKEYKLYLPTPTLSDFTKIVDPTFLKKVAAHG